MKLHSNLNKLNKVECKLENTYKDCPFPDGSNLNKVECKYWYVCCI